jgi:hypothetical protein
MCRPGAAGEGAPPPRPALTEDKKEKQERQIDEAKHSGFDFSKKTQELLRNGQIIHLLDPIRTVKDWDEAFIYSRTDNILSLAWDRLAPWLGFDDVE